MAKHQWIELPSSSSPRDRKRWFRRVRQCAICGRAQEWETDYLWMRVTGYRWSPPVGRCPGAWDPNETGLELGENHRRLARLSFGADGSIGR